MNGGLVVRFAFLVASEIFFFAALNLFDDWTLQQMHSEPWMRALIIAPVLASMIMLVARDRAATQAS